MKKKPSDKMQSSSTSFLFENVADSTAIYPSQSRIYHSLCVQEISPGFHGLFSRCFIKQGMVVAVAGGNIVKLVGDIRTAPTDQPHYRALVDRDLFVEPHSENNPDILFFINHSCDSNLKRVGGIVFVASRDIAPAEQLCLDYAPLVVDVHDWSLKCECKSESCRGAISSSDWSNAILARKLWEEWLPHTQQKILEMKII